MSVHSPIGSCPTQGGRSPPQHVVTQAGSVTLYQVLQGVWTLLPSFQKPLIPRKYSYFGKPTAARHFEASVVSGINIYSQMCFYYFCVCACPYVCGCLWEPERTLESPEPGVISSGELPEVDAGNGAGVPGRTLTTEPSFQPRAMYGSVASLAELLTA